MKPKVVLSWSGGKDSALALHALRESRLYEVVALLTTVDKDTARIPMHGVRESLLEQQAAAVGVPLRRIPLERNESNTAYDAKMATALEQFHEEGISNIAIGDIFLEDVRQYREERLHAIGFNVLFPLWGQDPSILAHTFIKQGFKAVITCVNTACIDHQFLGCKYDETFLTALPTTADPCGENGEFHSFVYDGPIFDHPIALKRGEMIAENKQFPYCDFAPASTNG